MRSGNSGVDCNDSKGAVEAVSRIHSLLSFLQRNKKKLIPLVLLSPTILSGCGVDLKTLDQLNTALHSNPYTPSHGDYKKNFDLYQETIGTLNWVFELLSGVVLWTPPFIFNNEWFGSIIFQLSLLSAGLVTVGTMIEGIKRMCGLNYTPVKQIAMRFPIALGVSAFAPYGFVKAIEFLNKASQFVVSMGTAFVDKMGVTQSLSDVMLRPLDILALSAFNVVFFLISIPILLRHGKRWFDMVTLGAITPLAMTAWIFKSFNGYFKMWLTSIKNLTLIQLVYAVFITILSLIMFAVPFPPSVAGIFMKLLVIIGGLWRMAFPPSFISKLDSGVDSFGVAQQLAKKFTKIALFKKM